MNKFLRKIGKSKIGIKRKRLRKDILGLTILGLSAFVVAFYFGRGLLGAEDPTEAITITPTMTSISTNEDFPFGVSSVRILVTTDMNATCAIGTSPNPTTNMTTTGTTDHFHIIQTPTPGTYTNYIRCRAGSGTNWGEWSTEEVATARICGPTATNGTVMQTINCISQCPLERVWAVDARDDRTYWIKRILSVGWKPT
jgi:hypothetical protein